MNDEVARKIEENRRLALERLKMRQQRLAEPVKITMAQPVSVPLPPPAPKDTAAPKTLIPVKMQVVSTTRFSVSFHQQLAPLISKYPDAKYSPENKEWTIPISRYAEIGTLSIVDLFFV